MGIVVHFLPDRAQLTHGGDVTSDGPVARALLQDLHGGEDLPVDWTALVEDVDADPARGIVPVLAVPQTFRHLAP